MICSVKTERQIFVRAVEKLPFLFLGDQHLHVDGALEATLRSSIELCGSSQRPSNDVSKDESTCKC